MGDPRLRIANAIVPHPDVQYNLASACLDAGRFEEALQLVRIYLAQPTPPPDEAEIKATIVKLKALVLGRQRPPDPRRAGPPSTAPRRRDKAAGTKDDERLRDLYRSDPADQRGPRQASWSRSPPAPGPRQGQACPEVPASPVPSPSPPRARPLARPGQAPPQCARWSNTRSRRWWWQRPAAPERPGDAPAVGSS